MPLKTKFKAHLLVEGNHDLHVISALCQKHSVPQTFAILPPKETHRPANGVDQLLKNFGLELRGSANDTQTLGLVLDADEIPDKRWQDITKIIYATDFGYQVPLQPEKNGTIIPAPNSYKPRLGIWLMPDNHQWGELEDFMRYLIPTDDKLVNYSTKILDEIEAVNLHHYGSKRSKAFIHTWLAWQKEPGLPMGRAITSKVLSADATLAQTFVHWLNKLFNPTIDEL